MKNKKLLVLGGKSMGTEEIIVLAKQRGYHTIVTDYLPQNESYGKQIADECWDLSTDNVEGLINKIRLDHIDGVFTGVNEFNLKKMFKICEESNLPCYCNTKWWNELQDKENFKNRCAKHGICITPKYNELNREEIVYPVIVKPADGSGSNGFSVCTNDEELERGIKKAKQNSETKRVLIEKYMNYKKSVIINYTIINGRAFYSGMSDKISKKISDQDGPIMAFQIYPSELENKYLSSTDNMARKMLEELGFEYGVFWIESFVDGDSFVFNEMGVRFGGSLTYLPVKYLYGIDQLDMLLKYAMGEEILKIEPIRQEIEGYYCIFPVHLKSGVISRVEGIDTLKEEIKGFKAVPVHGVGDKINNWGSARQVFAYIHYLSYDKNDAEKKAILIAKTLKVIDDNGENMLFNLFLDEK